MMHKNHNYVIEDSLFADNNIGVDIDRTDGAIVRRTVIIGVSDSYKLLMARQDVQRICNSQNRKLIGLDLHTWTLYNQEGGAYLEDISLSGFDDDDSACDRMSIHVDLHNIEANQFEFYSAFRNIQVQAGSESTSFCDADNMGIKMVHFVDLDGSLSPSGVSPKGASALLGTSPEIHRFVDQAKCTAVESGCYSYCTDTCLRSIRYETSGTAMDRYVLKACKANDSSNCSTFHGSRRGPTDPRSFIAHLPVGNEYNLYFLDASGRKVDPPSDGVLRYDFNVCPADSGDFSVTFDGKPIPNLEPAGTLPPGPVESHEKPATKPTNQSGTDPGESMGIMSAFWSFLVWLLNLLRWT